MRVEIILAKLNAVSLLLIYCLGGSRKMNDEFELFFNANERRIHFQIHNLGIKGSWYSEFYTEGIFALWQGYRDYDPERGEIGTYLNYRIRYRLLDLIRKKEREQKLTQAYQEQEKIKHTNGNYVRNDKQAVVPLPPRNATETDVAFWHDIRAELTEKQWKWVKYFIIADLTIQEIMEIENVSADAVKGWGQEVRKKLRNDDMKKKIIKALEK